MAKADPNVQALAQVGLFQGLTPKELAQIARLAKPYAFRAGHAVVEQGEPGQRFYLITAGTAEVRIRGRRVRELGPGDYFGELGLIDEQPRSATVVATSDLETLAIAAFNFRPLLKADGQLTYKLLQHVVGILRDTEAALAAR